MRQLLTSVLLIGTTLFIAACGKTEPEVKLESARPAGPSRPAPASNPTSPIEQPVSEIYKGALKANLDGEFAAIVLADGRKTVVPQSSLSSGDRAYLSTVSKHKPLVAPGTSSLVVVESTDPQDGPKKTIEVSKTEGPVETVQLCSPNVAHDQIEATCMLYARVHWLDIAGYYVDRPAIYKIINDTPPDAPWTDPKYVRGLETIMTDFKNPPKVNRMPPGVDSFKWARDELRRGRPILAALPREMVEMLPAGFLASYPWSGGSVGHQIVINGFTWNDETNEGTFHVVNSWADLLEFDIDTKYATGGALIFEASLSPKGEVPTVEEVAIANEFVENVTYIKPVGEAKLFEVTTNLGVHKIIALDADAARGMVEQ